MWKTIALSLSAAALSRIASSSRCWSHVDSPGFEGQSMLATVATHAARNSRAIGGGSWAAAVGTRDAEANDAKSAAEMITGLERMPQDTRPIFRRMAKYDKGRAWKEARELVAEHRGSLAVGMALMVVNRLAGFVLPWTSKYLIDDVIGQHKARLLMPLAAVAAVATIIQAGTSFALSQVVSIAAQRAITDMRKRVQAHVLRLPISYFDSTKTGVLISRIMTDAEGVRNLVGTGLVQLVGGIMTAVMALVALFWLNWKLTSATLFVLAAFGGMMTIAFKRLRPMFRERSIINAEVTGRLTETIGGIRLVKVDVAA